jgi:2-polyprenyl-3-methyl-5-hydroxy-6-metoxy-1,4-benzoquinol methylase
MIAQTNSTMATRSRPACYLCGSQGDYLYQGLTDNQYGTPGLWDFRKCPSPDCGLVWLDPMPVPEALSEAYRDYFTHAEEGSRTPGRSLTLLAKRWMRGAHQLALRLTPLYGQLRRRDSRFLDAVKPGRLLDVGCGAGDFLAQMRQAGWVVEGQEVDPEAAAHARSLHGFTVHLGSLEELGIEENTFDAVTMNHVIEHVHDPVALLAECQRILKPGGVLVSITPNVESFSHQVFQSDWVGMDRPRHLHLFSARTMEEAARRAGLRSCEVLTTVAHARDQAMISLLIRRRGTGEPARPLKQLRSHITAIVHQMRAWATCRSQGNAGDECVLMAVKSRGEGR